MPSSYQRVRTAAEKHVRDTSVPVCNGGKVHKTRGHLLQRGVCYGNSVRPSIFPTQSLFPWKWLIMS